MIGYVRHHCNDMVIVSNAIICDNRLPRTIHSLIMSSEACRSISRCCTFTFIIWNFQENFKKISQTTVIWCLLLF